MLHKIDTFLILHPLFSTVLVEVNGVFRVTSSKKTFNLYLAALLHFPDLMVFTVDSIKLSKQKTVSSLYKNNFAPQPSHYLAVPVCSKTYFINVKVGMTDNFDLFQPWLEMLLLFSDGTSLNTKITIR